METETKKQENSFFNLLFNVIVPSFILIKGSGENYLGPFWGLIVALSFPITYGIYDFIVRKDFNVLSLFGFLSVLLTGIISLVELDKIWIIIKETSIPLLIVLFMFLFRKKGENFFSNMFMEILDQKKVEGALKLKKIKLESIFSKYYLYMVIPFLVSAFLNFLLAFILIKHDPGTSEYVAELGKMTALSFPVIALPSMICLSVILYLLFKEITKLTGYKFEEIVKKKLKII